MKVYIAQLKCPGNHCVLAAYGEYESDQAAKNSCRTSWGRDSLKRMRRGC
jgi:hypothetical protein